MIARGLLYAAILACAVLGVGLWWVAGQRDSARANAAALRVELAVAKLQRDQAKEAAKVHKAWLDAAQAADKDAADREAEFQNREGGDAPLSDFMRDALDRVR